MKIFILTSGMTQGGPIWMNIFWPHYMVYRQTVPTVLLETPYLERPPSSLANRWAMRKERQQHASRLVAEVKEQMDPAGPNILLAWALNTNDIVRATFLDPVWKLFDHRVLTVLDTIEIKNIDIEYVKRFDLITGICGDIGNEFTEASGIPHIFFPPHTDVLSFQNPGDYRPIDMMIVGRRENWLHDPIHRHFNDPKLQRLSLDYLTRGKNFMPDTTEEEAHSLLATYGRSKISFCFEPSHWYRFAGRSPLTERWVHSWTSGCTVVGTTPRGTGAADQMDWPEATINLPETSEDAIALVSELLADTAGLKRRRYRNIAEAARRHDSRHRLQRLFHELDLPVPEALTDGLNKVDAFSQKMFQRSKEV